MIPFIVRILGNSVALYIAVLLVPGFLFNGGVKEYAIAGVALGLLNLIIKPIVKLIAFPLIILTLGLFTIIINALLLWVVDYIFDFVTISDVITLVWATIVISAVNIIISALTKVAD